MTPPTDRPFWSKWYDRQLWRGPNGLRYVVLARDPVCMICHRVASTVADHIVPHKGSWILFCDLTNLQGICDACHSIKTSKEDGGWGRPLAPGAASGPAVTGDAGKQFQSNTLGAKLDKALDFDARELLDGIPE